MTRQRNDSHSTEFGLWLRQQPEIDSKIGFTVTNIDYLWLNYKSGLWMLVEEKRYGCKVRFPQDKMFSLIDKACKSDKNYMGFHIIIFEKTSPDDGKIWLDAEEIDKQQLIKFLHFNSSYSQLS